MQSQTSKVILAIVVTAIVVGGGVYVWQNKIVLDVPQKSPQPQPTTTTTSDTSASQSNYINSKWKFSLKIPEGYLIGSIEDTDTSTFLSVVKKPTPDNDTPLPEMNIIIEQSNITSVEPTQSMKLISKEAVTINGVQGVKSTVSYSFYPAGNECPIYRLHHNGVVYDFSLYECLDSGIFEKVVESFTVTQ